MTESFLTVPTAGLSDDLNELVDLVNNDTTTINDDNKEEGGEGKRELEQRELEQRERVINEVNICHGTS